MSVFNLAAMQVHIVEVGYRVFVAGEYETVTEDECIAYEDMLYCTRSQYRLLQQVMSPNLGDVGNTNSPLS